MHDNAAWTIMVWKTIACLRAYPGIGPVTALQAVAQSTAERAFFTDLILLDQPDDLGQFLAEVHRKLQTQMHRDAIISGAMAAGPSS